MTTLSSVRARRRLEPLAAALEARPGSDAKELGRIARQVAATRAWPRALLRPGRRL